MQATTFDPNVPRDTSAFSWRTITTMVLSIFWSVTRGNPFKATTKTTRVQSRRPINWLSDPKRINASLYCGASSQNCNGRQGTKPGRLDWFVLGRLMPCDPNVLRLGKRVIQAACTHGTARHGSVWFGLVRFGSVWFGLVRFGSVWFGLVRFGFSGELNRKQDQMGQGSLASASSQWPAPDQTNLKWYA